MQQGLSWSGNERNHTFLNLGDGKFVDVSRLSNADVAGDGRSVAIVDWDDDGKLDLILKNRTGPRVQIFHNRYPSNGNFLSIDLVGNGTTCNRDAIGSRVTIKIGARTLARTLHAGEGFLSQSSKRLHFGLGEAQRVERVTVLWPDGTSQVVEGVAANTRLRIVQGETTPVVRSAPESDRLAAAPHRALEAKVGRASRVVLAEPLPMAAVRIPAFTNAERRISDLSGKPLLLNVWGRECTACMNEFIGMRTQRRKLDQLGFRIVTMNADRPIDEEASLARLARYDLDTSEAGYVDDRLRSVLWETYYPHLFGPRTNLSPPSPTSLLLDADGRLLVMYMGRIDLRVLEADVREILTDDPRPVLDRLSHGYRLIHHPRNFSSLADAFTLAGQDDLATFYRDLAATARPYRFVDGERKELRAR